MARMCESCGVAPWQPCQCDPRAGLDGPDPRNFNLPQPGESPWRPPRDSAEVIARLSECLGDIAAEHRQGASAGVALALDRLILEATRLRSAVGA